MEPNTATHEELTHLVHDLRDCLAEDPGNQEWIEALEHTLEELRLLGVNSALQTRLQMSPPTSPRASPAPALRPLAPTASAPQGKVSLTASELPSMRLTALRRLALAQGVSDLELDNAIMDSDQPKASVIELLLPQAAPVRSFSAPDLKDMKVGRLAKLATAEGVSEDAVEEALDDEADPRGALVSLLLGLLPGHERGQQLPISKRSAREDSNTVAPFAGRTTAREATPVVAAEERQAVVAEAKRQRDLDDRHTQEVAAAANAAATKVFAEQEEAVCRITEAAAAEVARLKAEAAAQAAEAEDQRLRIRAAEEQKTAAEISRLQTELSEELSVLKAEMSRLQAGDAKRAEAEAAAVEQQKTEVALLRAEVARLRPEKAGFVADETARLSTVVVDPQQKQTPVPHRPVELPPRVATRQVLTGQSRTSSAVFEQTAAGVSVSRGASQTVETGGAVTTASAPQAMTVGLPLELIASAEEGPRV
eukprot:COSAG05_NODE_3878_length_1794_cov_1.462537_1_plen_479_part_10